MWIRAAINNILGENGHVSAHSRKWHDGTTELDEWTSAESLWIFDCTIMSKSKIFAAAETGTDTKTSADPSMLQDECVH